MNKVILIICIIMLNIKTETLFSANIVYDVNNIKVEGKITTDNDRAKLVERGIYKAFIKFINKTLLQEDIDRIKNIQIKEVKDLIFAYQIVENKINKEKKNELIINVKFQQNKINQFLIKKGIPYSDVSDISLTVFPIFIREKEIYFYSDNFFYNNWQDTESEEKNTFVKYNLALENIEDFEFINLNKDNLESIDVKKLLISYENKNYAFVIISLSKNKLKVFIKTSIQNKEIIRNLNLKFDQLKKEESFNNAIKDIKNEIKQIWKSQNLVDFSTPSFLDFSLEFNNINDFLKMKNILDKMELIDNYSVLELTKDYAKLRIKYNGRIIKIKEKFNQKNILVDIVENEWKLKMN